MRAVSPRRHRRHDCVPARRDRAPRAAREEEQRERSRDHLALGTDPAWRNSSAWTVRIRPGGGGLRRGYNPLVRCPFPGMDPWLEHPALWPDVHNSVGAAIRDELTPCVAPRYYVALERRTYHLKPDDLVFVGRPDVAVIR